MARLSGRPQIFSPRESRSMSVKVVVVGGVAVVVVGVVGVLVLVLLWGW